MFTRGCRFASWITSSGSWDSKGRWLEDLAPCLPHTDILFVNEDEARMLTGTSVPAEVAAVLRGNGAHVVVLKLSRKGCAVFAGGEEFYVPPFRVNVVDTTGAGDCFVAGFLAALDRGLPLQEAARFANAVGALTVQMIGSVEGVLAWEETEAWMRAAAVNA
jgi:sugar/nucleoside kinase (ribokinase family)